MASISLISELFTPHSVEQMERVRESLHPSLRRLRSRSGGRLMDSVSI
ncbi:unnamed protein product [Brassica oleracea]